MSEAIKEKILSNISTKTFQRTTNKKSFLKESRKESQRRILRASEARLFNSRNDDSGEREFANRWHVRNVNEQEETKQHKMLKKRKKFVIPVQFNNGIEFIKRNS